MALFRRGGDRSRSESSRTAAPFLQVAQRFAGHFTPPKPPPRMIMRLVLIRGELRNLPAPASLVTTEKLPVRCVLRWIWLHLQPLMVARPKLAQAKLKVRAGIRAQ